VEKRVQSTALAGSLLVTILVTAASISVLTSSPECPGEITTAPDAIWWAIYTMLTIGYDKAPVTTEGWALGAVLGSSVSGSSSLLRICRLLVSWIWRHGDCNEA